MFQYLGARSQIKIKNGEKEKQRENLKRKLDSNREWGELMRQKERSG